jgi:IS5 family transposase
VVGIRSFPGNPYDGHTLDEQLEQAEILSGTKAKTVAVDLGYRGRHRTHADIIHRGRKLSKRQKKRLKRRSMIEAMIGHMKNDGLMGRCHLKGLNGDACHALLCGIGHNLRLLRAFIKQLPFWFRKGCLYQVIIAITVLIDQKMSGEDNLIA